MRKLSEYLFEIGYFPIEHQSVKHSFLQWYYNATQSELVIEGLDLDNSQLTELTLNAAKAAEDMDSNHPTIELLDSFENHISRMKVGLAYLAIGLFIVGAGTLAVSVYTIDQSLFRWIGVSVGSILGVPAVGLSAIYLILEHQIRTNADLVAKFNQELVERPGNVRRHDRDWHKLAAQYLWNRSLNRPKTIIILVLLSVIKVARPRLYGAISGEIQRQVGDFVGKDAKSILKAEVERAYQGKFIPPIRSETSTETVQDPPNNEK